MGRWCKLCLRYDYVNPAILTLEFLLIRIFLIYVENNFETLVQTVLMRWHTDQVTDIYNPAGILIGHLVNGLIPVNSFKTK